MRKKSFSQFIFLFVILTERGQPDGAPSSSTLSAGTATGSTPRRRTTSTNSTSGTSTPTYAAPTASSLRRGTGVGAPASVDDQVTSTTSTPPATATSLGATATPQHRVKRTSSRLMTGGGVRQRTRSSANHHISSNSNQMIQCPLCGRQFAKNVVEVHAATCEGRDTTQVPDLIKRVRLLNARVADFYT